VAADERTKAIVAPLAGLRAARPVEVPVQAEVSW
jgi:hypothetical protein